MRTFLAIAAVICAPAPLYAQPPEAAAPAQAADPAEPPSPAPSDATAAATPNAIEQTTAARRYDIALDGFLRFGLTCIQPGGFCGVPASDDGAEVAPFVGHNDGFMFGAARLNVRASLGERLYVRLGFDGAVSGETTPGDPVGRLETGLRDAYMRYSFARPLQLYVGRFKPPFDIDELSAERELFFADRSLESRGVAQHEGLGAELTGFRPGRHLGVMLGGDAVGRLGPILLGYAVAVTNGNRGDATMNDNDLPAGWGRLTLAWGEGAASAESADDEEGPATYRLREGGQVGLSAFYNEATFGEPPNRFKDRVIGAGLDMSLQYFVFVLRGQLLGQKVQHLLRDDSADVTALGGHVLLSARVLPNVALYPSYRFAFLNPNRTMDSNVAEDYAQVIQHSVGVRYGCEALPLLFYAGYTLSRETGGRSIPNDRFDAAMQVDFE